jgi:hypothetical protein
MTRPFACDRVADAFDLADDQARVGLLALRDLILETAESLPDIGPVEEALRWGQPSYISRKGTPLRLGVPKSARCGLFVHCQSRVIPNYLERYPAWDRIDGTRAVLFDRPDQIEPLRHSWLIRHALTYKVKGAPKELP